MQVYFVLKKSQLLTGLAFFVRGCFAVCGWFALCLALVGCLGYGVWLGGDLVNGLFGWLGIGFVDSWFIGFV